MSNKIEEFLSKKFGEVRAVKDRLQKVVDSHKCIENEMLANFLSMSEYYNVDKVSYVYFLTSNLTGLTKIGVTGDLTKRIKSIKSNYKSVIGADGQFKLVALIPIHDSVKTKAEKYFHDLYNDKRCHGEWFNLDSIDDFYSIYENIIMIGDTYILLEEFEFDKLERILNFEISLYDVERILDITYPSPIKRYENEIFRLYNTVVKDKINFTYRKLSYTKDGILETIHIYPTISSYRNINISEIKEMKIDKEEILSLNKYLDGFQLK